MKNYPPFPNLYHLPSTKSQAYTDHKNPSEAFLPGADHRRSMGSPEPEVQSHFMGEFGWRAIAFHGVREH